MGAVCPQGHDSASSDFCTVCGTRVSSSPPRPEGMTGKHHAPGRFVASASEPCPRCGEAVTGQFCEACGFRVSARRPFAPLGHQADASSAAPAEAREMSPSGPASFGPPASLFPPVPKPEPPFSAWSRPQPAPSPPSPPPSPPGPPPPSTAPAGRAVGAPEAAESPDEPTVVVPFESLFSPASRTPPPAPASSPSPPASPPPAAHPEPSYSAPEPAAAPPVPRSRPEPPTGPLVRAAPPPAPPVRPPPRSGPRAGPARAARGRGPADDAHTLSLQRHLDRAGGLGSRLLQQDEGVARRGRLGRRVSGAHL